MEGAILDPEPADGEIVPEGDAAEAVPEVPSVFSVTNRHLIAGAAVTEPMEDGSRIVKLVSANGGTVLELNLAQTLCEYLSEKLVAIEVIEQEDEAPDASDEA